MLVPNLYDRNNIKDSTKIKMHKIKKAIELCTAKL